MVNCTELCIKSLQLSQPFLSLILVWLHTMSARLFSEWHWRLEDSSGATGTSKLMNKVLLYMKLNLFELDFICIDGELTILFLFLGPAETKSLGIVATNGPIIPALTIRWQIREWNINGMITGRGKERSVYPLQICKLPWFWTTYSGNCSLLMYWHGLIAEGGF